MIPLQSSGGGVAELLTLLYAIGVLSVGALVLNYFWDR